MVHKLFSIDPWLKSESFDKQLSLALFRWCLNQRIRKTEYFKEKMKLYFLKRTKNKNVPPVSVDCFTPDRNEMQHYALINAKYRKKHDNAPNMRI